MPIVATAGHVDHGKSTLVEALTGSDPDRWAEEKERGLTIDLGFAWTDLGGHDVGFVDVPGHERFIKNMLAGVGAVDCALLVVAADEGWMPQTEEHAAVLDLLEITRGVIALTRADLVDDDTLEIAELEIIEETEGTRLEGWPIVAVSSVTRRGLSDLSNAIVEVLDQSTPPEPSPMRMWVDRAFVIAGAGTIATGTVLDGTLAIGDDIEVLPDGRTLKVRGLQHHGGPTGSVGPGDRTAISFTGDADGIERGDLLAAPGTVAPTTRLLASLVPTRAFDEIPPRGAFHLHVGTASRPATIRSVAGTSGYIVTVDRALPVAIGDRIVLRDSGRKSVVGGGRVVDPDPPSRLGPRDVETMSRAVAADTTARASAMLDVHGTVDALRMHTATRGGEPTNGRLVGDTWVADARITDLTERAIALVEAYQESHPTRPGMPKPELASQLDIGVLLVEALVGSELAEADGSMHTSGFSNELSTEAERAWVAIKADLESSFDVPRLSALQIDDETVHFLLRRGDLVRIERDLAFTDTQAAEIVERVAELPDGFTVSEFKDHFGMARRQAVPTLEWLDAKGRTRRSGDGRTVRG